MDKIKRWTSIVLSVALLFCTIAAVSVAAVGAGESVQIDQKQICIQGYDTTMTVEEFRNNKLGLNWSNTYYEGTLPSPFKQPDYTVSLMRVKGTEIPAYCIQHGVPIKGDYATQGIENSPYWKGLPENVRKGIVLATLYGYPGNKLGVANCDAYIATQAVIWEFTEGYRTVTGGLTNAYFRDQLVKNTPAKTAYNTLVSKIEAHSKQPSFNEQTIKLSYDNNTGKFKGTLTDASGILSGFSVSSSQGLNVSISGNTLNIVSNRSLYGTTVNLVLAKKLPSVGSQGFIVLYSDNSQNAICGQMSDPVYSTIHVTSEPAVGSVKIVKTSEDGKVDGIEFRIEGDGVNQTITTKNGGQIQVDDLVPGVYTVTELTDEKYAPQSVQRVTVVSGNTSTVTFKNVLKKFQVTVTKSDAETGTAQGDASLAGATYGIFKGGELVDSYTTDASGSFTTRYYVCDNDWTIQEISPSEGYLLDPTVHHVGAEPQLYSAEYNSVVNDVMEQVVKGKIALIKHTDDGSTQIETPETGATFEVFLKSAGSYAAAKESERDILTCDENGFAETKKLPYGVYTVRQTSGWAGREQMKPFDVFVHKDGQTYRYLLNNSVFEALVQIVKTDAETGKTIPAAGVGFRVRNRDTGAYVVQHLNYPTPVDIDTFYTDESGTLLLPDPLPYGNYEIIEVQTAHGYVLDGTPVPFAVDGTLATVTVEKRNLSQKGKITVAKTGEVFDSVSESDGMYKPVYEAKGLSGAVYEISAAEDIYTPDGTLRYAKGERVDTVTTGADGIGTSKELYLGRYEIKETKAPHGMVLNDEIHTVELTYAGQEIEITETATEFYNERQKVEIDLSKVMEQDETFGIGNNSEILSVQFGLFAAEDIVAADGTKIPKGGLIETVSCDENGHAIFATDLPVGAKLYVKEIATDSRYILSDTQYPVGFAYAGQDTATVHITVNNGDPIENDILRRTIRGHKTDRETGDKIDGALFGLFRDDEVEFSEKTAILTSETIDGEFSFTGVPCGNWIVVELRPAEGYLPNTEPIHVSVTTEAEIIEIAVVNDKIPELGTTATVNGKKEADATGEITIEDKVRYKHLIPGKEYTLHGVLMNKATGEPLLLDGRDIHSETTFVPETADGEVTVYFVFDAKGLTVTTETVVFERLYCDKTEIAVHADLSDEKQTITLTVPEAPMPELPKTGDNSRIGLWLTLAVSSLVTLVALFIRRKKSHMAS